MKTCPACLAESVPGWQPVLAAIGFPIACRACKQSLRVAPGWQSVLALAWVAAAMMSIAVVAIHELGLKRTVVPDLVLIVLLLAVMPVSIALFAQPRLKPRLTWFQSLLPWALLIAIGSMVAIANRLWMPHG